MCGAKSGDPESSQGPSDICEIYSQMLCQLSYRRLMKNREFLQLVSAARLTREKIGFWGHFANAENRRFPRVSTWLWGRWALGRRLLFKPRGGRSTCGERG